MRGTFFVKPCEIIIEIPGEEWSQGTAVSTIGSVNLHQDVPPGFFDHWAIALCSIDLRKSKKRDPLAFTIIEKVSWKDFNHSGTSSFNSTFNLTPDCLISDGTWTQGILAGPMGEGDDLYNCGRLDLTIKPWEVVTNILTLFENFKRFKMKNLKNKGNKLVAKMIPPASTDLGGVDGLDLIFTRNKKDPTTIELTFQFQIKRLGYEAGTGAVEAKKEKVEFKHILAKGDYFQFGDAINQDKILAILDETIESVKTKSLF